MFDLSPFFFEWNGIHSIQNMPNWRKFLKEENDWYLYQSKNPFPFMNNMDINPEDVSRHPVEKIKI